LLDDRVAHADTQRMKQAATSEGHSALIVDDHPIVADALAAALLSLNVLSSIDRLTAMADALRLLQSGAPYDLVILDLHLTDTEGLESLLVLREHFPEIPVVIFSADESSQTIVAAFEKGIQGYVPKSTPMAQVINDIRYVLSGGTHVPSQAMGILGYKPNPIVTRVIERSTTVPSLSPRQRQVLHYSLQGLPNKTVGRRLDMADGTVKSHLNTIYRLFAVNNRAQLILRARELGLI
jgi:DNA-binding NarL/FixJ family response regulator